MKTPSRLLISLLFALTLGTLTAQPAKPGYKVMVQISFDEQGQAEAVDVTESDDPTAIMLLNQIAGKMALQIKQPPRMDKDGKPMKFKVLAPFNFPVEGDEGAAANNAPKPSIRNARQPLYPEALAAAGTVGGAILELNIGADGRVSRVTVLRASHPEFADSAQAAVQQWEFAPAKKDDVPVESRWRIAVNFAVNDKEADWKWRVAPRPSLGGYTVVRPSAVPPAAPAPEAAPAEKK